MLTLVALVAVPDHAVLEEGPAHPQDGLDAEPARGARVGLSHRRAGQPSWTATAWCRCSGDRAGIAKADDIVDAWASLERLRCLANDVWARRDAITPSFELRRRPPALEVHKRLPGANCKACGEPTCTAFAWAVWRGAAEPQMCLPRFEGGRRWRAP